MHHHAPADYTCPVCLGIQHAITDDTLIRPSDIVLQTETVTVFINSFFMDTNPGHAIVVPNEHYENLYDLPPDVHHALGDAVQRVAAAMRQAYRCDGITTRQNNEPAADQHAFHYHHHVIPRYTADRFNNVNQAKNKRQVDSAEREAYAKKLRAALH